MIKTLLSSYRSVIALNCRESITDIEIRKNVPVIAADGAAQWIESDYIIGDGDSFKSEKLILIPDQNTTDFEKCISFVEKKDLLPSLVIGMNNGEMDHVLGNTQVLLKHTKKTSLFFLDAYSEGLKIGIPLERGNFHMQVKPGATVSLFSFVSCIITTKGLVWELTNQLLLPNGLLAFRNRAGKDKIEFDVCEGKVLIIINI